MELLIQILGWVGTFLVVLAYFLVSYKKISPTGAPYQLMNLFGVIGVGVSVFQHEAWAALALQAVWGIIAAVSLIRLRFSDR
jgi:hypothetical protein